MPKHHSEDYKITAVKHYINKSNYMMYNLFSFV